MTTTINLVRGITATVDIEQDEDAQDPTKDMDMAAFHVFDDKRLFWRFMESKGWTEEHYNLALSGEVLQDGDGALYMGLERYSHSGDVYALCQAGRFPDRRWDVSPLVGFISPHPDADSDVIDKYKALVAEGKVADAKAVLVERLNQDIRTYNHWISGEVYGYVVQLRDADGEEIGDEDSCWGFIGDEDYCLQEAMESAYGKALNILTKTEIQEYLNPQCPDDLAKYVQEWSLRILSAEEQEGSPLSEIAHRLHHYITETYLKGATAHELICRVKGSVWDEYDQFPKCDWRYEVAADDTVLGYWEWVEHKIEAA